ncbi:17106_t:CDS:2, partial [Acaulospora morrowiae]
MFRTIYVVGFLLASLSKILALPYNIDEDIEVPLIQLDKHETIELPFWSKVGIAVFLVLLGGLFAGLTLGLMSLDETNLHILASS